MKFYVIILNTVFIAIAWAEDVSSDEIGEYGYYFEGDMLLTDKQHKAIEEAKIGHDDEEENAAKNGIAFESARWPNKTVVYEIREKDFNKEKLRLIQEALDDIASKSCIKFRKRESDNEHAVVIEGRYTGCFSNVGYIGTRRSLRKQNSNQVFNLSDGCFSHGTIVHEMLHTLGFYHMQSTYDRDDYVTIFWENIQNRAKHNFNKYLKDTVTNFGVPYDYGSVMHYPKYAFSKNGKETIIPKKEGVRIGQRNGPSKRDIIKLNRMYNCSNEATTTEKEGILDLDVWNNVPVIRPYLHS